MADEAISDPEYAEACRVLAIAQARFDAATSELGRVEQVELKKLQHVTFEEREKLRDGPLSPLVAELTKARQLFDRVKAAVATARKRAVERAGAQAKAIEDEAINRLLGKV